MLDLERSLGAVPQLLQRDSSPSTNSELVARAADSGLPDFTTLVTTDQTAGRGRLDRSWIAPAGTALAISVLVRVDSSEGGLGPEALGWLPLAAGSAMSDAVSGVIAPGESGATSSRVGVKWPNDVQIDGRKVCGILSELLPSGDGVVIGSGVNVTMSAEELPVPTATSLVLAGADEIELFDRVLSAYLTGLRALIDGLRASGGDAERSGLRAAVVARCTTIGREVRVELPGGAELFGRAVGIDPLGRLEVRTASGDGAGRVRPVAAGDIIHLR